MVLITSCRHKNGFELQMLWLRPEPLIMKSCERLQNSAARLRRPAGAEMHAMFRSLTEVLSVWAQLGAGDCLIGWCLFYLSFAQADRGGEKEGELRMVVNSHSTTMVRYQGSGLLSAIHAECPASSWHGMKELEPHPHIELLQGPPVRSKSEVCIVASRSCVCTRAQ